VTTIQESRAGRRQALRAARPRRSPAVPLVGAGWAGGAAVLWLWWRDTPFVERTPAELLTGAGRISGLAAGYVIALVVLLMSRLPVLERRVGSDRVARWHAMCGRYAVGLVVVHVALVVGGYAAQERTGLVEQAWSVVTTYPEMGKAAVGTVLVLGVAVVSATAVRRRLRYETWYYLHLLTYLAVYLAFWHQLAAGEQFAASPAARIAWYTLYAGVGLAVVWYRLVVPVRLNLRHQLRVEGTVVEAPDVVSILIRGRRLDELGAEAGQFFRWRFLSGPLRWTANPYSLSAPPRHDLLRITVKALGGHSAALSGLRPGTRVWAEGPYGAMTAARRRRSKVLLLAGGTGITPLRALFETLPAGPGDLTLLYRASRPEDLALWEELQQIAAARKARLIYALNGAEGERPEITVEGLRRQLPDLARHEVYLCGPDGLMDEVYAVLRAAGVPHRHIHHESFAR
jgi:predicted ferric reductase